MKIFLLLLLMISSYQLSRAQTVGTFDGILNTNSYYEKVLYVPSFPNGTSNLAVDVILGNTSFLREALLRSARIMASKSATDRSKSSFTIK